MTSHRVHNEGLHGLFVTVVPVYEGVLFACVPLLHTYVGKERNFRLNSWSLVQKLINTFIF